jgi:hypothetical protein
MAQKRRRFNIIRHSRQSGGSTQHRRLANRNLIARRNGSHSAPRRVEEKAAPTLLRGAAL